MNLDLTSEDHAYLNRNIYVLYWYDRSTPSGPLISAATLLSCADCIKRGMAIEGFEPF